jgi:hypothetical protein
MTIHFGKQVYIVTPVAALPTSKDSFPPYLLRTCCGRLRRAILARPLTKRFFDHVYYGQCDVAFQRDLQPVHGDIASFLEEFYAGESSAHFKACESGGASRCFAGIQQQSANALARPVRMNKERSNFRGVSFRIE